MGKLEEIVSRVEAANFTILDKTTLELSEARAHNFFEAQKGELSFPSLVRHMCSGPVCAMVVARMSAISVLQQLAGPASPKDAKALQPTSIRGMYARDGQRNAVHCSESEKLARTEIAFFFPNILQNPLPDADETQDFLLRKSVAAKAGLQEVSPGTGFDIEPSLLQFVSKGLVSLCQTRPHGELNNLQALEYLSTWLVNNNPNKPMVAEPEGEIGTGQIGKEIQRKLAGGEAPLALEMKLKLPVLRSAMSSLGIGRYLITGLTSQTELMHFEQEVAEI